MLSGNAPPMIPNEHCLAIVEFCMRSPGWVPQMLPGSRWNNHIRYEAAEVDHRHKCDDPFWDFHKTHLSHQLEKDVPEAVSAQAGRLVRACMPPGLPAGL